MHLQNPAAPKVSAEFEAEITRLAAEGLQLKEAVEASLEPPAHHLAAILARARPKQPNEAFEFRIIESDNRTVKTVFRRSEFFFTFAKGELGRLNASDLNGDGLKELIIQSSSGGNCWGCNPIEIYRVRDHKGELIAAGPIQRIADLDRDGIPELLVTDSRWEVYDDLSHAASPSAVMIYAWRGGRYVYASPGFAAYYKSEIDRLRAAIGDAKTKITTDEFSDELYIGLALALAITYAHLGEPERGVKEMETLLNANAHSPEQVKHRSGIITDFHNGEGAKRLRELKPGDPML